MACVSLRRAFTLVEILIVVVILGVLAAVVVPRFANATQDAASQQAVSQLTKLRNSIAMYYVRHQNNYPVITPGDVKGGGSWGPIHGAGYFRDPPLNLWAGREASDVIIAGTGPNTTFPNPPNYGWIWNQATGEIWAAGIDANDQPLPKP